MQMKNGLASAAAIIDDGTIAIEQTTLFREFGRDELQFSEDRLVRRGRIVQCGKMLAGNLATLS